MTKKMATKKSTKKPTKKPAAKAKPATKAVVSKKPEAARRTASTMSGPVGTPTT